MNVLKPATANGSSSVPKEKDLFASQDGLLRLLVAIRGSSLPSEYKMTARDAVLEYSQQTDIENRTKIKEDILSILSPYQNEFASLIEVLDAKQASADMAVAPKKYNSAKASDKTSIDTGFRSARPVPVFKNPAVPPPEVSISTDSRENAPASVVVNKSEITNEDQTTAPIQTAVSSATVPTSAAPSPNPAPVTVSEPAVTTQTQSSTIEGHQERIKAIKRSVNERVGNPINLIDTNNDVGREYMNALLDAMKKVSGDGAGADAAMNRLEVAYQSVEELLRSGVTVGKQSKKKEQVEETQTDKFTPPANLAEEQSVAEENPSPEPEPPTRPDEPVSSNSAVKDTSVTGSAQRSSRVPLRTIKLPADEQSVRMAHEQAHVPKSESVVSDRKETITQVARPLPVSTGGTKLRSLADTPNPLKQSSKLPIEDSKQVTKRDAGGFWSHMTNVNRNDTSVVRSEGTGIEATAPLKNTPALPVDDKLFNPDVNTGLEQLLSEWRLFKSSGLFGTGPGGKDHPLYKTLARLPMAAVIAGRFEGATPEVKQSITDYMNGWRYEQGLIHELNENFEHYLRRVISHILSRTPEKKTKNDSI